MMKKITLFCEIIIAEPRSAILRMSDPAISIRAKQRQPTLAGDFPAWLAGARARDSTTNPIH